MSVKEDLHHLIDELPESYENTVFRLLERLIDKIWLDGDIGGPLPPFDWGPEGPPRVRAVKLDPEAGLVVEGGK